MKNLMTIYVYRTVSPGGGGGFTATNKNESFASGPSVRYLAECIKTNLRDLFRDIKHDCKVSMVLRPQQDVVIRKYWDGFSAERRFPLTDDEANKFWDRLVSFEVGDRLIIS